MSDWARLTIRGLPYRALDSVQVDNQGVALRFRILGPWPSLVAEARLRGLGCGGLIADTRVLSVGCCQFDFGGFISAKKS